MNLIWPSLTSWSKPEPAGKSVNVCREHIRECVSSLWSMCCIMGADSEQHSLDGGCCSHSENRATSRAAHDAVLITTDRQICPGWTICPPSPPWASTRTASCFTLTRLSPLHHNAELMERICFFEKLEWSGTSLRTGRIHLCFRTAS